MPRPPEPATRGASAPQSDAPETASIASYLQHLPQRGKTTDDVGNALREAILDGVLAPGTWLREDRIAQELRVSRTPIREAIRRLADEGLVMKTAHYGSVVAPLSLEDVLALYVVREQLEGLAARLAAQRLPSGLLGRLEELQQTMADCTERDDIDGYSTCNLEFHRELRRATGNAFLERFLLQVEHAVRRLRASTLYVPGRMREVLDEHAAIIAAIARQDPDEAATVAQRHMQTARATRVRAMLDSM